MLPLIFSPSLNRLQLLTLNLPRLLDRLWNMSMSLYPSDLRHMFISLHKRPVVFQFLTLARGFDTFAFRSVRTPETDVTVVGTSEEVL